MLPKSTIVFVCEHGAAKSIIAATYFNHLADQRGLQLHAIARGTNPDSELSEQTLKGLAQDGLTPVEPIPRKLSPDDLQPAQRIVSFCDLSPEDGGATIIEQWVDVPPVSQDYEKARTAILNYVQDLLNRIGSSS